ncbi:Macrophage migration inhibitory factor [Eumeta japonica]|uniref:L-dopachrome isomerase n=1 Tax=Eumeta variegata TaxID=151549 RepID=A0A4C1XTN6_EUMVA|nr:Macrophage migration inhibitory factor [Eumeta japonica]
MPQLIIETNIPRSKIPADFISKAIPLLAQTVNRDEKLTAVVIHPDVLMSFGGSDAPTAIARVVVIDRLGPEENKKYCKVLFEFIEKELGVPQDRSVVAHLLPVIMRVYDSNRDTATLDIFITKCNCETTKFLILQTRILTNYKFGADICPPQTFKVNVKFVDLD